MLALVGARHVVHVNRARVNEKTGCATGPFWNFGKLGESLACAGIRNLIPEACSIDAVLISLRQVFLKEKSIKKSFRRNILNVFSIQITEVLTNIQDVTEHQVEGFPNRELWLISKSYSLLSHC